MKTCSMCKESLSPEHFYPLKKSKDGLQSRCKSCTKKYYKDNKEEIYKKQLAQHKLDYETKGCLSALNKISQAETNRTISQFTALDQARIAEQSSYETKQRIFFGGLVLIAGFIIITMFNNKNK